MTFLERYVNRNILTVRSVNSLQDIYYVSSREKECLSLPYYKPQGDMVKNSLLLTLYNLVIFRDNNPISLKYII